MLFSLWLLSDPVLKFRTVVCNTFGAGCGDSLQEGAPGVGLAPWELQRRGIRAGGCKHSTELSDADLLFAVSKPVMLQWDQMNAT